MTQMTNHNAGEPDARHIAGWKLGQGDKKEYDRTYGQKIRYHSPLGTSGVIFSQTLTTIESSLRIGIEKVEVVRFVGRCLGQAIVGHTAPDIGFCLFGQAPAP